jgi:hypothetical protein
VILSLAALAPAQAGDYYGDGYYRSGYHGGGYYGPRYRSNVWYSSSCCYKKVVRHVRQVHYHRIYREGYYDRPYRYGYYDPPYRYRYGTYDRPYRHGYYERPYRPAYYDGPRYYDNGYDAYNSASYTDSCYRKRVPLGDGRGGWVWGLKTTCY